MRLIAGLLAIALLAVLMALFASPVTAQCAGSSSFSVLGGSYDLGCGAPAAQPGEPARSTPAAVGAGPAGPTVPMIAVPTAMSGPDGAMCLGFEDRPAAELATGATPAEENVEWILMYASQWLDPCAGAAVPALTPAMWAYSWLRSVDLPVPDPQLGVMWVVGVPPPLHIGSVLTAGFSEASPFGPASMAVTSEVWIDWGDGEGFTGPFATAGSRDVDAEPFPHVWQHDGFYDVTVQQRWTAEWSVGGARGTLDGLTTEGTREAFEVISIEAVGAG